MRKLILVAIVLVIVGIGAAFLLLGHKGPKPMLAQGAPNLPLAAAVPVPPAPGVPAPVATPALAANVDVEAEYNAGRRSFPIVSGLADKKINAGDRPGAVAVLEEYVKANPSDVQARKKLAEQYQLAGRQADYNAQLEQIASLAPTVENLRVLSDIYNSSKDYPKQVEVLKKIVAAENGSNAQTFVDLATIQVVIGDKDGALATLNDLHSKHPDFQSYAVTRIQVNILAEKGKADDAFNLAKQWIDSPLPQATNPAQVPPSADPKAVVSAPPSPAEQRARELADLCNILHYSGHAEQAVALVEPHIDWLQNSTELVVAYVNANITLGRDEHAYQILAKIDEAGRMTPELYIPYMQLAIKRQDITKAEDIAKRLDIAPFNEEQALNLIETARANNAPTVTAILLDRFGQPQYLTDKPVLTAVIAIMKKDKDQDQKINVAINMQLSSVQRVRLAEACARNGKTQCFDTIVKQYPPIPQMTPQQVSEYASLFIIANRPADIIAPVGVEAAKPGAHPDVQDAYRRLASAAGRDDIMKPWLVANGANAPILKLQEYFYLANDRGHHAIATDIAERIYARDPSPMARDLMIAAYMGAGSYDKALPFLREQIKQPGANDGQYVAALSHEARRDPKARKELTDYSLAALQANKGDQRQQLNYAYALINNGQRDKALPFAKQYAQSKGGEWKKMYAQLTLKPGSGPAGPKLSKEQLIAMAQSPSISAANKRQIAFQLVNLGDKQDATAVFADLAKDKGPDSQEVKDLMYMWGGKLNPQQLAWVQSRAANATPYDKQRWGELINASADDYAVLQYVSATPDALYNHSLRQRYFRVLAQKGGKKDFDYAMRPWVAQTSDVPALSDYAKTAQAFSYQDAATLTYQRILKLDPTNEVALDQMSAIAFSRGSYSRADQYINRYMSAQAASPRPETNPAQAHFFKAELFKQQHNLPAARQEYGEVVRLTPPTETTAPDALSRLYTAEFNLGYAQQAKAGFEQLLAAHQGDKGILADYMSALIEFHYYDDASRVANQYDRGTNYHQSALTGTSSHVASIQPFSDGREIKISFDQPIEGTAPIQQATPQWAEATSQGYDSVTISAKPGYLVRYMPTANQQFAVVATPATDPQQLAQDREEELRLQLLYAQIEQQRGQNDKARVRLNALAHYYPNNPEVLAAQASLASASGNSSRAAHLLQQAQSLAPDNESYTVALRSARTVQSPQYIKLDGEYRNYGNQSEFITTLSGVHKLGDDNEFGANLMHDYFLDQHTVAGNAHLQRDALELFLAHYFDDGSRVQGSLFTDGDWFQSGFYNDESNFGAGLYYAFTNELGRTQGIVEWHKPYWDFPQAVAFYTDRDRIGFTHYIDITPRLSFGAEASYNRYNMEVGDLGIALPGASGDNVAQSALIRLNATYALQQQTASQPFFGVAYGFDGEYFPHLDSFFGPLLFADREVHELSGIYRDDWGPQTHVLFAAGWDYDRFNGNGPMVEGRLTQDITQEIELGLRARWGLDTQVPHASSSQKDAINAGAYLMYKF